jgi:hypothetical protein
MKTIHITRNKLFAPFSMILLNNITEIDTDFFEDNSEMFTILCDTCKGVGEVANEEKTELVQCDECMGEGSHDVEFYQYFLTNADQWEVERLKSYGVSVGYSELLGNHIIGINDFGISWSAFSYSKEVDDDYELSHDETLARTTVY